MRSIRPLICAAILAVNPLTSGAFAMSKTPSPSSFTATCVATSSKTILPAGLCDAFVLTLGAAGMKPVVIPSGQQGDVTLVVSDASASRLSARIDRGTVRGIELATTRKGAPLDKAAFTAFLTGLIAATPSLK